MELWVNYQQVLQEQADSDVMDVDEDEITDDDEHYEEGSSSDEE